MKYPDMTFSARDLAQGVLRRDRRSVARLMTAIENEDPDSRAAISELYPHTGNAYTVGVTGPPGSGKSTLIGQLAKQYRKQGKKVGIIAVDPSSPFSGGAFLGDRIRMQELSGDEGVFVRSMATRGSLGGLARSTADLVSVLDAFGCDIIFVETVGAGQSEVDVIKLADTIVLVMAPGLGDDIQAIKAGIMEIGDIIVVNKADRENAERTVLDIMEALELDTERKEWSPSIVKTIAISNEGVEKLVEKLEEHRSFLRKSGVGRRKMKGEIQLLEAVKARLAETVMADLRKDPDYENIVEKIASRQLDPYEAATALVNKVTEKKEIRRMNLRP